MLRQVIGRSPVVDGHRAADRGLYARWLFRRITPWAGIPFCASTPRDVFVPKAPCVGVPLKTLVPAGHVLAGDGHRLQRPPSPAPLHAAGTLGGELQGSVVDPDRSATGGQHGLLVWLRAWIEQGFKITKRAAGSGSAPHDQARAGGAPVARRRRGHPVAAECPGAKQKRRFQSVRSLTSRPSSLCSRGCGVPHACGW